MNKNEIKELMRQYLYANDIRIYEDSSGWWPDHEDLLKRQDIAKFLSGMDLAIDLLTTENLGYINACRCGKEALLTTMSGTTWFCEKCPNEPCKDCGKENGYRLWCACWQTFDGMSALFIAQCIQEQMENGEISIEVGKQCLREISDTVKSWDNLTESVECQSYKYQKIIDEIPDPTPVGWDVLKWFRR